MRIYCDESGYTGGDFLHADQPYFVYSGVKLDNQTEKAIKDYVYANYNIQNAELKGKLIVNSSKGRKLLRVIFKRYGKNARIVFHDKKYALAAKIIEYGIEPYLPSNYFFYQSKLNEYLASGLYANFILKDDSAEKLFSDFLLLLRGKKSIAETSFHTLSNEDPLIEWLLEIITHKPEVILDEVQSKDGQSQKWILDLTMTSLLGILTDWSKNGEKLDVVCDNSKVFDGESFFDSFNEMGLIGSRADFLGTKFGFNLSGRIRNADSKDVLGLQIADLFSSTVFYCLKNGTTEFSHEIMSLVKKTVFVDQQLFVSLPTSGQAGLRLTKTGVTTNQ